MTAKRPLSRRDSLKRIAATGALVSGSGIALGSASTGASESDTSEKIRLVPLCYEHNRAKFRIDNEYEKKVEVTWKEYSSDQQNTVTVSGQDSKHFYVDADEGDVTVTLHYNGDQIDVKHANDQKKCDIDPKEGLELEPICYYDGDYDSGHKKDEKDEDNGYGKYDKKPEHGEAKFKIENPYNKRLRVVWKNYYSKQYGSVTLLPGKTRYFWAKLTNKGKAKVGLYYDDEKIDEADADTDTVCKPDPDMIRLSPVCYDKNRSKFRIDNDNRQPVEVTWKEYGGDQKGTITVDGDDSKYFYADAYKGDIKIALHYKGEKIGAKQAHNEKKCIKPEKKISIEPICYKGDNGKKTKHGRAKFKVRNHAHRSVNVSWKSYYRHQSRTMTLKENETRYLWVTLDKKGKAKVGLFHHGKLFAEADANTDVVCEEDDNDDSDSQSNAP